jgi:hypothetical protein
MTPEKLSELSDEELVDRLRWRSYDYGKFDYDDDNYEAADAAKEILKRLKERKEK